MRNRNRLLVCVWIACAVLFLGFVALSLKRWLGGSREGTYLAGTFQGTFSVGKNRVRVPDGTNGLVIAELGAQGQSIWMRAFTGLATGRAVAHLQSQEFGVAVVGVLHGELKYGDRPDQALNSYDRDALFIAVVGSTGRVTAAGILARAEHFASPDIEIRDRSLIAVAATYRGPGDVGGKELPVGDGRSLLRVTSSPRGIVIDSEVITSPASSDRSVKRKGGATPQLMEAQTSCNICRSGAPMTDPNCELCRQGPNGSGGVCQADTWCCDTGWDRICQDEAFGTTACLPFVCDCPHSLHDGGEFLNPHCISGGSNCAARVCEGNFNCGWISWNPTCVDDAKTCP